MSTALARRKTSLAERYQRVSATVDRIREKHAETVESAIDSALCVAGGAAAGYADGRLGDPQVPGVKMSAILAAGLAGQAAALAGIGKRYKSALRSASNGALAYYAGREAFQMAQARKAS